MLVHHSGVENSAVDITVGQLDYRRQLKSRSEMTIATVAKLRPRVRVSLARFDQAGARVFALLSVEGDRNGSGNLNFGDLTRGITG
jgi:hypothetical protein